MNKVSTILDERIAIALDAGIAPEQIINRVKSEVVLDEDSIELIKPHDDNAGEKLEKKSSELGEQMLYRHLSYALIGLLIGMIVALVLISFGPDLFARNPLFTFMALISPGLFIGVFLAGARALKPQHDVTNLDVMQRKRNAKTTLLIKTQSDEQKERVEKLVNSTIGLTLVQQ